MSAIIFGELMAKMAWFMAKLGAGTASLCNGYQPPLPFQLITK